VFKILLGDLLAWGIPQTGYINLPLFLGDYEFIETINDFGYTRKIMRRFKDIEVGVIISSMACDDDYEEEEGLVEITTKIGMFKHGLTVGYRLKKKA